MPYITLKPDEDQLTAIGDQVAGPQEILHPDLWNQVVLVKLVAINKLLLEMLMAVQCEPWRLRQRKLPSRVDLCIMGRVVWPHLDRQAVRNAKESSKNNLNTYCSKTSRRGRIL